MLVFNLVLHSFYYVLIFIFVNGSLLHQFFLEITSLLFALLLLSTTVLLFTVFFLTICSKTVFFLEQQLKWQTFQSKSVIGLLIYLCNADTETNKSDDSAVVDLKKMFNLADFQYEWVIMNTLCKAKQWDKLVSRFVKTVRCV